MPWEWQHSTASNILRKSVRARDSENRSVWHMYLNNSPLLALFIAKYITFADSHRLPVKDPSLFIDSSWMIRGWPRSRNRSLASRKIESSSSVVVGYLWIFMASFWPDRRSVPSLTLAYYPIPKVLVSLNFWSSIRCPCIFIFNIISFYPFMINF